MKTRVSLRPVGRRFIEATPSGAAQESWVIEKISSQQIAYNEVAGPGTRKWPLSPRVSVAGVPRLGTSQELHQGLDAIARWELTVRPDQKKIVLIVDMRNPFESQVARILEKAEYRVLLASSSQETRANPRFADSVQLIDSVIGRG